MMQNFRPVFIDGAVNIQALTFKDHTATAVHCQVMLLEQKEKANSVVEYTPLPKDYAEANINKAIKASSKRSLM